MIDCADLLRDPHVAPSVKTALEVPAAFLEAKRRLAAQRALRERHAHVYHRRLADQPATPSAFGQLQETLP